MSYNRTLNRICKPLYKIGQILVKITIILLVIGLVIGLSGHGWLILIIASGCLIVATILSNIPNSYLVNIIKNYDPTISAKEATNIAQKHLQESGWDDSSHFVMNIMDGFERVKRLNIK